MAENAEKTTRATTAEVRNYALQVRYIIRSILSVQTRYSSWFTPGKNVTTAEMQISWDELTEINKELKDVHKRVFLLSAPEEEKAKVEEDLQVAQTSILSLQINVGDALRKRTEKEQAANYNRSKTIPFKLEKLSVPKFNGKPDEWQSFEDLFESSVGKNPSLNDSEKIAYLKQALTGEASSIVSRFPASNSSYDEAWNLVKKRYNNLREIVFAHMRKFFELKPVSDSSTGLRQLCDIVNECWRSLKNFNVPVNHWDLVFVYVALQKMEPESRKEWLITSLPTLDKFLEFFEKRATALADSHNKVTSKPKSETRSVNVSQGFSRSDRKGEASTSTSSLQTIKCPKCGQPHFLYHCPDFQNLSISDRKEFVKRSRRSFNCLRADCSAEKCQRRKCKECGTNHHTLLHFNRPIRPSAPPLPVEVKEVASAQQNPSVPEPETSSSHTVSGQLSPGETHHGRVVLMETVLVDVVDSCGNRQQCRVFLDSGSESHFVSEQCIDRLGLPRTQTCVKICGIGGAAAETSRGLASLKILSKINSYSIELKALILSKVTASATPRHPVPSSMPYLEGLELADPNFHSPSEIDILIGAPLIIHLSRPGIRHGPQGFPSARNTVFGWVLSGETPVQSSHAAAATQSTYTVHSSHARCSATDHCIDASLKKFWELEEPSSLIPPIRKEDEECETWFQSSVKKVPNGSYSIGLPFLSTFTSLGNSRHTALRRFLTLEKSLAKSPEVRKSYHDQMKDFLDKGWMEEVPSEEVENPNSFYLPHHIVTKEESSTMKHRIVFDASAKSSNGLSLNNVLRIGPKLQVDLVPILLQFRTHVVAMSADIVKFYNAFHIHKEDTDFQRLLYRTSPEDPVRDMRMLRVTFGVAPAPFLAIRCLHHLADEHIQLFPRVNPIVKKEFLVDNLLSGAPTAEDALRLQEELIQLMGVGKLHLRKWTSNVPALVSSIPSENQAQSLPREVGSDGTIKTIGILWNPSVDTFSVKLSQNPFLSSFPPTFSTKRQILSGIAKIFDPLGWLSPLTIRAKIMMQDLWKLELDWDSHISDDLFLQWKGYCLELPLLNKFCVPRCVVSSECSSQEFELHGFCDASINAYAACVYLKCFPQDGTASVNLLVGKTRVAPVKGETIPRLELCSAELLSKLMSSVLSSVALPISSIHCWSDSTCVLHWITSQEKLQVFQHNRVRKILSGIPTAIWNHVKGEENPADCASRGISVKSLLTHPLWYHGPPWLLSTPRLISSSVSTIEPPDDWFYQRIISYIHYCSSFSTLRRHLAVWIRYVHNCNPKLVSTHGPLTVGELEKSIQVLVRCVQMTTFQQENLWCARKVTVRSCVKSMAPFLDDNGILRVGGRMRHSFWSYDQKHPILLPRTHHFTTLLVRHLHESHNHPGPQLLLSLLRDKFWISNVPKVCAKIVRRCLKCHKANPRPMGQMMGQLPMTRITPAHPFNSVGVDYAGPFHINATPGRNPRLLKGYAAIFVCLAIKAIHLEFVSDLSTPGFLAAFDRFVSTRGTPALVLSDGGTNFLGAKNEVEKFQQFITSSDHVQKVTKFFVDQEVEFSFNPPRAPHHGGIFEAGVKSMKVHLHRVTDDRRLSIEEFWTLLKRIEATLNSRPLTQMSSDANDFSVLTPGHFLIGRSLKAAPQRNLEDLKIHQMTRWQHVQQMAQHFNRRWSSQYVQSLQ